MDSLAVFFYCRSVLFIFRWEGGAFHLSDEAVGIDAADGDFRGAVVKDDAAAGVACHLLHRNDKRFVDTGEFLFRQHFGQRLDAHLRQHGTAFRQVDFYIVSHRFDILDVAYSDFYILIFHLYRDFFFVECGCRCVQPLQLLKVAGFSTAFSKRENENGLWRKSTASSSKPSSANWA